MYEQPTQRTDAQRPAGRLGPAILSGLAVLAIIAGLVGYLGTRKIIAGPGGPVDTTSNRATTRGNPDGPAGPGDPRDTGTPQSEPTTPSQTNPAEDPAAKCPDVTVRAVRDAGLNDKLTLLLYVSLRRSGANPAEAWVCKNADGTLFYQGHIRARPLTAATSNVSILLGTGIKGDVRTEGSEFVATNPEPDKTTEYHVSAASFTLVNKPGDTTSYEVVRAVTPQNAN